MGEVDNEEIYLTCRLIRFEYDEPEILLDFSESLPLMFFGMVETPLI